MTESRPTVADDPELDAESLDHYCWLLVSDLDNFLPFDEMVERCVDDPDHDESVAREKGYHAGALNFTENHIEHLVHNDIDVLARAQRYVAHTDGVEPLNDAIQHCSDGMIATAYERSEIDREL